MKYLLLLIVTLVMAGCQLPHTKLIQKAPRVTVEQRILLHPRSQNAHWPVLASMTGALLIAYPGQESRLSDEIASLQALGLHVAAGRWVSQPDGTPEGRALPLTIAWHQEQVNGVLSDAAGANAVVIDTEAYNDGSGTGNGYYYTYADFSALKATAVPWQTLGNRTLYILPSGPPFYLARAIAHNARLGGTRVVFCCEWTYWGSLAQEAVWRAWVESEGYEYLPGYVLGALKDRTYTNRIAAGCWLYPRHGADADDDLAHFGTPEWAPAPVRFVAGDCNCDGITDTGDINPFVLALSDSVTYMNKYHNCPLERADCNLDSCINFDDIAAFMLELNK